MIYFVQAGEDGPVKIGRSVRPLRRLGSLQDASPVELHLRALLETPDDPVEERQLHRQFKSVWIRGEWFEPCDELLRLIDELAFAGRNKKLFGVRGHQLIEWRRA